MKTFAKMIVAALVGLAVMCIAIAYDASDRLAIGTYFVVAIAVAALLGVFDESAKSRHMSLKDGARGAYDKAA